MEHEMDEREDNKEKWVYDSSLDHKGRVPLRASTGVWKASLFVITIEFSERLCYFGIVTNLITYLTKVMHQDLKTAAKNVNNWAGVTTMMPLVGGLLADSYTGRFFMIMLSSIIYLMGLGLLTMSQFIPILKPCNAQICTHPRKVHEVAFFLAIYFLSLGTGGHKPCLESFGADQFDDDHPQERKQKMSYFNWWNFALCCGLLLGVTLIAYVEDYVGWGVAYLILTITVAITIIVFYLGKPFYRYRSPEGSPLTPMLQVLVAAIKKRNLPHPSTPNLLYEVPKSVKFRGRLLHHTRNLRNGNPGEKIFNVTVTTSFVITVCLYRSSHDERKLFLDKAAIIEGNENLKPNPWRLATVTKVEEMKLILNMIPIWLTSLTFGVCVAQASTFFIKQSATMYRKIGPHFEIPPASANSFVAVGTILCVTVYEKILVPVLRRATGNERGINILRRIGIGMIFSTLSMATAALVERKRLRIGGSTSMSVFWLAPQFMILGIGDGFTLVGLQEYFYDQVPDAMRSLGIAFFLSVIGAGSFLSSFLISVVDHVTEKGGKSWFGKDLNRSRLDKFYWLLAAMNVLNLCVYVWLAKRYSYKNVQRNDNGVLCDRTEATA